MIARHLAFYVARDAGYYPVVTITGPRQSGKTTLARSTFPSHAYVSLEPTDERRFAREDPRGFLARYHGAVIVDEVQNAPELLSYVQAAVDENPTPGRFVLTGSQNLLLMSGISQSLAGRTGILNLLPFSRAELEREARAEPDAPETIFAGTRTRLDPWETIRTGFYPPIHDRGIPAEVWMPDYVRTYVERDVRSLANVGDLDTFERFLGLCAGRAGQLLSYSGLASDAGIAVDTARRWVSLLKTGFIVFTLQPHHRNFNKRLIKTPKLYFHDTGVLCWLLGIRDAAQLVSHPLRGAVFENYVVAEVNKAFVHHRRPSPLFFWRDRTGHEVDLLIELAGELFPVEVKSTQTPSGEMLEGLRWWSKLAGVPEGKGTLVYAGTGSFTRNGVAVRPWFAV